MGRPLLVGSRRDFLIGACAFLLPQSRRKILPPSVVSPIRFREIASQAGLDFVLQNNPTPRKHMIETMPGGVAAFDYKDRKSTRLNSSHLVISYAVFCLKKKKQYNILNDRDMCDDAHTSHVL